MKARSIETVPYPLYSPDLAPCDFWLLSQVKLVLRGRKFKTNDEVAKAVEAHCETFQKGGLAFVFQKWQGRWKKCTKTTGSYFEKEHM